MLYYFFNPLSNSLGNFPLAADWLLPKVFRVQLICIMTSSLPKVLNSHWLLPKVLNSHWLLPKPTPFTTTLESLSFST